MTIPYASASSGEKAMADLQKILRSFGCSKFGTMLDDDDGVLILNFKYRDREICVKASYQGYAAAMLRDKPYTHRMRCSKVEYERRAMDQASVSVYSILRDWVKGQIMAIETGILSFEGAFLGQILLPNGNTVLDQVVQSEVLLLEGE